MSLLIGIDEVGRGPWAGPVVACAVALGTQIDGLKDSKQLSPKRRQELAAIIIKEAQMYALGSVSAKVIDNFGIGSATALAMRRAIKKLDYQGCEIIIDGNINLLGGLPLTRAVVRADQTIPEVSAASIVAKVARDEHMTKQAKKYQGYGFESNFGYGTPQHQEGIKRHGICPIHRKSFKPIKAYLEGQK